MTSALERSLRLPSGEGRLLLLLGGLMFANALAMQVSYVASVSGFLKSDGLSVIWLVWLLDYAFFLAIAAAQSLFIDRFDRVLLMRGLIVTFIVAFAAIWVALQMNAPGQLAYGALYLLAEQQWMLFPVFYWVLANGIVDLSQAKRLFPLIASFGLAGNLLGLAIAASAPMLLVWFGFDLAHLLLLNIALYAGAILLPGRLRPKTTPSESRATDEGFRKTLVGGWDFVRNVAVFRHLTVALLVLMVVDTLIEFHFLAVTDRAFSGQAAYQSFYGTYRIVIVTLAFGIQSILTHRILARTSLQRVLSIQPLLAIGVAGWAIAVPGLAGAVGALFVFRLVGETFHDTAKKALQGLVPEERRGRVSLMLESVVISVGTMIGAVIVGAVTIGSGAGQRFAAAPVYLAIAIAMGIVAVVATWRMRATYETSLLNWRLRRRKRTTASILDDL